MRIRTIWCAEERPSPTSPALRRARASTSACSRPAATGLRSIRRTSTARRRTACSDESGRRCRTRRPRRSRAGRTRRARVREVFAAGSGGRRRSAPARLDDRPCPLNDAPCPRFRPRTEATTAAPPAIDGEWLRRRYSTPGASSISSSRSGSNPPSSAGIGGPGVALGVDLLEEGDDLLGSVEATAVRGDRHLVVGRGIVARDLLGSSARSGPWRCEQPPPSLYG